MTLSYRLFCNTLASATLLCAGSAYAGAVLEFTIQSGNTTGNQTVYVADHQLRMDVNDAEGQSGQRTMLYDAADNVLTLIDHDQKTYTELDKQSMTQMRDSMTQMQDQMRQQLEAQMQDLPEEQRQAMQQMLDQMNTGSETKPALRVEKTEQHQTVSGYDCQIVNLYRDGNREQQWCVASYPVLGLSETEAGTFKALLASQQTLAGEPTDVFSSIDGFPISSKVPTDQGDYGSELIRIESTDIDEQQFQVPSGYSQQDPF